MTAKYRDDFIPKQRIVFNGTKNIESCRHNENHTKSYKCPDDFESFLYSMPSCFATTICSFQALARYP